MVKSWLPLGISDYSPHLVDANVRGQISIELKAGKIEAPTEQFFKSIDRAVSMYKSYSQLENESSLADMKKELKKARNSVERLCRRQPTTIKPAVYRRLSQTLNNLGSNSRAIIYRATGIYLHQLIESELEEKRVLLGAVWQYVGELPKAGRTKEHSRIIFACDLADAFFKDLGVIPVTTTSKAYVQVLGNLMTYVLNIEEDEKAASSYGLADKALRIWRKHHEILVETKKVPKVG